MLATIELLDEVNCKIGGLSDQHIRYLISHTKQFVDGAREKAAFKIGAWDGFESRVSEDGTTFNYMLGDIVPMLEGLGYEIEIEDWREDTAFSPETIESDYLKDYGIDLRYYQVDSINAVVEGEKGIIEVATSGGKTLICGAIAKLYASEYRTITIVPSEKLANQTYKQYIELDLDASMITGKITGKKREKAWENKHLVITWQTLNRNRDYLFDYHIVMYDETHEMGDVMYDILANYLGHAHIRVGLTGTVPKSDWKREKIMCHIGGDVLYRVKAKQLMDEGHIASVDVALLPINHEGFKEFGDWEMEQKYLMTNVDRMVEIAEVIKMLPQKNTLILVHAQFGWMLADYLGLDFIDKDTPSEDRESYFEQFDKQQDYNLVATFRTVGTGVSIDDIYQLVMIDVGKSFSRIIQGIGRGCRKDSQGVNHLEAYDIYSRTKYSLKHLTARKKAYREEEYDFEILEPIAIKHETN